MLVERVGLKDQAPTRTDDCCHRDPRNAVRGSQGEHKKRAVCVCMCVCACACDISGRKKG